LINNLLKFSIGHILGFQLPPGAITIYFLYFNNLFFADIFSKALLNIIG